MKIIVYLFFVLSVAANNNQTDLSIMEKISSKIGIFIQIFSINSISKQTNDTTNDFNIDSNGIRKCNTTGNETTIVETSVNPNAFTTSISTTTAAWDAVTTTVEYVTLAATNLLTTSANHDCYDNVAPKEQTTTKQYPQTVIETSAAPVLATKAHPFDPLDYYPLDYYPLDDYHVDYSGPQVTSLAPLAVTLPALESNSSSAAMTTSTNVTSAAPLIETTATLTMTATPTMTSMPYSAVKPVVTHQNTYVQVLGYVTETQKTVEAEALNFDSAATSQGHWAMIIAALALVIF